MTDYTILQGSSDWSALYVDNQLDIYGDHDTVHEALFEKLGVETRYTNDWIKNPLSNTPTVAGSLAEVEEFRQEKLDAAQKIIELEDEIERLKNL